MSDCMESESFWESWTSPGKRKRKKDVQKHSKKNKTDETDENIQKKKKKKTSKFKDAMVSRKAKKKEKRKSKDRLKVDDSKQGKLTWKPETVNNEFKSDDVTKGCKKKSKSKKKVAFDLSPGYIRVKRPQFVSSAPLWGENRVLLENEGETNICSRVPAGNQGPPHGSDSQCTSEDVNSQDLFITQKTFRASPAELSSCEVICEMPQMFTQPGRCDTSGAQINLQIDESYKCPQDLDLNQRRRKSDEREKKQEKKEEEEEETLNKDRHEHKKRKYQMELKSKTSFNPFLAEAVVVSASLDVVKPQTHCCPSRMKAKKTTSTQTEGFFSIELSSYLNFCQKTRVSEHNEDLKPLDLSLPQRARRDLWTCLPLPKGHNSSSPGGTDVEVKKAVLWSVSAGKGETSVSPQSESELKSADTTTSSEDNESCCRSGRPDLTQVRAVQMRLNESFFFKTKGDGQSPRPESPLMKLAQSGDVKSRKRR